MSRTAPELATPSPNHHTMPSGGPKTPTKPLTTEASNNPHFPETPFVTDCTTRSPIPFSVFRLYLFSCDAELDHSSVTYYSRLNHTLKRLPLQDRDSNCDGRPFCPELGAPPTFECHLPSTFPSRPTSPE
ncbi:hypothetical protein TNCV_230931 [Trichonephila clavipes]|nr:hypothetical protein TNCV_230931 [Trichonephila clavipes]